MKIEAETIIVLEHFEIKQMDRVLIISARNILKIQ